jgi:N-acetylglucosamine-6-sulfatase
MKRRDFLGGMASLGAAALAPALASARTPRTGTVQGRRPPNFVFIYTDDQRYDAIGALGRQPWLRTPNLDRMLAGGGSFRHAFVTTSLCAPSRSSFLTGCYAHRTGVLDNTGANTGLLAGGEGLTSAMIRSDVPRVLPILQQAGYATGYVGKIHIRNHEEALRGIGHVATFPGQGSYNNQTFLVNGTSTPTQGYITDQITRFAVEFVQNSDRSKPFALFVGHKAVHGPFTPDPKYVPMFENEWMPLPATWDDPYEGKPAYLQARRKSGHGIEGVLAKHQYTSWQRQIAASLVSVDSGVGQILRQLEAMGQLDDTIVIYSSDNGYFQGEHGLRDKRAMYEDSIRVPHLVHYPRLIRPGTVFDQMVLNIDVAPTLLDFAGVDIPAAMQGRSWRPVLEGRDPQGRDHWLYEYFWEKNFPWDPTQYGIRTRRFKYIRYPDIGHADPDYPMKGELPAEELYDLENDPLEMRNLANDPAASSRLTEMRDTLRRTVEETGYPGGYR